MNRVERAYFVWLTNKVCDSKEKVLYFELLNYLWHREFIFDNPYDENLAVYGLELRDEYFEEKHTLVDDYIFNKNCSFLEMMVSLSRIIERRIMDNDEFGDRTSIWFWNMISNLGLLDQEDDYFDDEKVEKIIKNFEKKGYSKSGKGGLFSVKNKKIDMRKASIWQQSGIYLSEFSVENGENM